MTRTPHDWVYGTARWKRLRPALLCEAGWRCQKCGLPGNLQIDHVQPLAAGGAIWDPANLQTLCSSCHYRKTAGENAVRQRRKPRTEGPRAKAWRAFVNELRMPEK